LRARRLNVGAIAALDGPRGDLRLEGQRIGAGLDESSDGDITARSSERFAQAATVAPVTKVNRKRVIVETKDSSG
jgi:hypothetical protein